MRSYASFAALAVVSLLAACELLPTRPPLPTENQAARLALSPGVLTLQQNQTADFAAVGITSTGDTADVTVTWSVTSGTMTDTNTSNRKHYGRYKAGSDTGKIKVVARGMPGGISDTAVVTVTRAPVAAVTMSPTTASVQVGRTAQLFATPTDANGNPLSGRAVTWATTNAAVATVNGSGLVSGAAAGAATITAASEGQTGAAAITVTVAPVAAVAVSPTSASVTVGQAVQLAATPKDANGNPLTGRTVTWATTNAAVATVSGSGLVSAMTVGVATITAASEGQSGAAAITVSVVPVASVTVSPAAASVQVGQTTQLAATPRDGGGNPLAGRVVTWSSNAPGVATVNGSGLVSGVAAGSATITARSEGQSATAVITVTAVPVASVTVSPATASVTVGQTVQFTATPKDAGGNPLAGRAVTWAISAPALATVNGNGLVTAVAAGSATITATSEGQSGTATVTVSAEPPPPSTPGTVTDLTVTGVTNNSVTLSFTEVSDGAGSPASYVIRAAAGALSWSSATDVVQGTCAVPMAGTAIGARRSCTVLGLQQGTGYQFQLVAFRGTLNVNAVFGGLSPVASGTTVSSTAPVATVTVAPASASLGLGAVQQFTAILKDANGNTLTGRPVTWTSSNGLVALVSGSGLVTGVLAGTATITATSEGRSGAGTITVTVLPPLPGGVVFESNWSTALGRGDAAVMDGARWMNYWEFNGGAPDSLLSVVSGASVHAPGGRNALKVVQRGSTYAANVQQDNVLPPSRDYYVRYYMRNDDNSSAGDHVVTVDTWLYANLTFMRKYSGSTGWRIVSSFFGCGYTYPIGHWGPSASLSLGAWYRFEYYIHFVDATHVQVHPRVYDASGALILSDADFRQDDWGGASWNGRSDWTLASYYAAGHSFCVNPAALTSFGLGNNGQQGAADTGLPWYFAGIQIRTDRWPGP